MKSSSLWNAIRPSTKFAGRTLLSFNVLALLLLGSCNPPPPAPPPTAHNLNYRLCLVNAGGVPYLPKKNPTVDGTVADDLGWTGATRYIFQNGTNSQDAAMQIIHDGTNLFISFEVNNDLTFDDTDVVTLAIDPAGTAGDFRRLHIFPFAANTQGSAQNQAPQITRYWKGDPGNWLTNQALPAGTDIKVSRSGGGGGSWSIEVQLPIAAFNIPVANYFGLYASAFKVNKFDFTYTENRWPEDALLTDNMGGGGTPFSDLENGTPVPDKWGNVTRGGATCNGVYFGSGDITTDQTPSNAISTNHNTVFSVDVHNSSKDGALADIAANNVSAIFKLANFGMGNPWTQITVAGNPTAALNINPADHRIYSTGAYRPGIDFNPATYAPPNDHQCVLVELNSSTPNTTFVNRSAWTNMNFQVTASPFKEIATIGTGPQTSRTAEGGEVPVILREYTYNTEKEEKWASELTKVSKVAEQIYKLSLKPGESAQIENTITPPAITIPISYVDVPPDTDADQQKYVRVPVKPGDYISVIVDRKTATATAPGGKSASTEKSSSNQSATAPPQDFVADSGGTVYGSWNNFGKSFVILGAGSLKVPRDANTLFLAIRYPRESSTTEPRMGFRVQLVETEPKDIYKVLTPMVTRDPAFEDLRLPFGINLPTWIICGERPTGRVLTIGKEQFREMQSLGCYGYIVRSIGKSASGNPK
jgi:hypothetical protein